ncbi:MAG: hypothetical protein ACRCW2_02300 [Cellulosilyticaceae bacterium]
MDLLEKNKRPRPSGWQLVIRLIICIIGLGWVFIQTSSAESIEHIVIFSIFVLIYVLLGYHCMPEPDYSNMGWMGGLMDNPLRISDDFNRLFLALKVLLYPGKFIGMTVVACINYIKG